MSGLSSQRLFLSYEDESVRNSPLLTARLRAVDVVKIYLCYIRRNAWHSDWYSAHQAGCFHSSLESAKTHAESNRKQGSVLYIEELPVLRLVGSKVSLLITEANHSDPLFGYSRLAASDYSEGESSKIKDWRDNYFVFGAPIVGAAISFHPNSRFWKAGRVDLESLVQFVVDPLLELEPLSKARLEKWRSVSTRGRKLDWIRIGGETQRASVTRLAKAARFGPVPSGASK